MRDGLWFWDEDDQLLMWDDWMMGVLTLIAMFEGRYSEPEGRPRQ